MMGKVKGRRKILPHCILTLWDKEGIIHAHARRHTHTHHHSIFCHSHASSPCSLHKPNSHDPSKESHSLYKDNSLVFSYAYKVLH
uniref:Uncharacterized protein n=1 Tax=Anguilla anguilla TaxID=7936 RepID=A0A0E9X779_ANGAN